MKKEIKLERMYVDYRDEETNVYTITYDIFKQWKILKEFDWFRFSRWLDVIKEHAKDLRIEVTYCHYDGNYHDETWEYNYSIWESNSIFTQWLDKLKTKEVHTWGYRNFYHKSPNDKLIYKFVETAYCTFKGKKFTMEELGDSLRIRYCEDDELNVEELEKQLRLLDTYVINGVAFYTEHHDTSLKKYRKRIQLDEECYYFLSIYSNEDGTFDKYSFDVEAAIDSHYEFGIEGEQKLKEKIEGGYSPAKLEEILINYLWRKEGSKLESFIREIAEFQIHYK